VLELDLRSTDSKYFKYAYAKLKWLIYNIGMAYNVKVEVKETTPYIKST
jgi:hypothetical protein